MVFEGVVRNGVIHLPPEAALGDGTVVRVEPLVAKRLRDLMDRAGTWERDDADRVVEDIYAHRFKAPDRASLDS